MISADDFDAYNKAVADMSDGLAKRVEASILAWMAEHPEASVAECREFAKEAMGGMVQVADDAAATLAAEWYDAQARAAGVQLESAVTASVYSPELVDDVARYQAKKLLKGDRQGFAKCCAELVRNDALKSLNETIIANVGRDGGVGMRFARVTTGKEDCDFCLMLESRGAVYWTRKTAGEMRRFHRGCDCKVVPEIAGEPLMTLVEGHDPVDAYSKYLDMIGVPPEEKPARIQAHIDEMVERSWKEPRPQRERRRKWKSKRFGGIDEMRDYALAAESMEDLRERSRVLEEEFKESRALPEGTTTFSRERCRRGSGPCWSRIGRKIPRLSMRSGNRGSAYRNGEAMRPSSSMQRSMRRTLASITDRPMASAPIANAAP